MTGALDRRRDPDLQARRAAAWCRLYVWGLASVLALLMGRVVQLKLWPGERLLASLTPTLSMRPEIARRGDVYDARGRLVATSTVGHRLFVDPEAVEDVATVAVDIAAATGLDPVEIDRRIRQRASPRYAVVCDRLEDEQVRGIRRAALRGVGLEPRLFRHYPAGPSAATIVGLVGTEHRGLAGAECAFDGALAHADGRLTMQRDARRRPLWIDPEGLVPRRDGRDVRLTIDLVLQEFVQARLEQAVIEHGASGGRAVVVRPQTGEILAVGDVLNPVPRPESEPDPARSADAALRRNRCATDPYEPGSTFKPYVWAAAVELGRARPDEVIATPAEGVHRTSRGRAIRDTHLMGPVPFTTVLVRSLNSGMAIVAERLSHRELREAVVRFGFGARTGCGIPGETAGLLTELRDWSHYTQTSVAMGHEIAVTPLQMARAFCAFARDGTLPALTLEAAETGDYCFVERACTPETAAAVRETLRQVMHEGGARAASAHHEMFGKSGTAQLPRPGGGGYYEDRYVSSFIAGAPYARPELVVLCVIEDPDRSRGHWGSQVAGPVVRDIVDLALE